MMMLMLALLVAVATAQPDRCCVSREFTTNLGEIGESVRTGSGVPIEGTQQVTYDYDNKILAIEAEMEDFSTGVITNTSIVIDYTAEMEYITLQTGACFYSNITQPMISPCIPDDAVFEGERVFGSGDETLRANSWRFRRTQGGNSEVNVVVTDNCTPILMSSITDENGVETEVTNIFTDFQGSIADRTPLTAPDIANCQVLPENAGGSLVGRRSVFV